MLRFRAFLNGLSHPPSRSLGEKLEDDLSVTSPKFDGELNGTNLKAKLKKDVRREPQSLWNICSNMALIRAIMPRKQESKRRSAICFLDERLLIQIFQYLPLVDQVCFALTCKRLFTRYKEIAKDGSLLPPQPTAYHLLSLTSTATISYAFSSLFYLRIPDAHSAPNVFSSSLERCLSQTSSRFYL